MKRLAALAAMLMLLLVSCGREQPVAAEPISPDQIVARAVDVGKDWVKVSVDIEWQGEIEGYGWALYDSSGGFISSGRSEEPNFKVEGLSPGTRYLMSVWVRAGDERVSSDLQLSFETDFRYNTPVAHGIDVSRWQGSINWQAVASDGVEFAILRLGYSGGIDRKFEEYYSKATGAGIDVGVYIYSYAKTEGEARQDAMDVIAALKGRHLDYPVYYDIEDDSVIELDSNEVTAIAQAFCDTLQENSSYRAGIYTALSMYYDRMDGHLLAQSYELWIAATADEPPAQSNFALVQHSHTGRVKGISGNVDLNIAFKNLKKDRNNG